MKVDLPIIVEGRYDKSKLSSLVEADIIVTGGFRIYKDREKLALIRRLAQRDRIIILTDSDRAGFQIRRYIAGAVPPDRIVHIYIPEILGKEKRKAAPGAQGILGVEGVPSHILRRAFEEAGVVVENAGQAPAAPNRPSGPAITKADLYALGFCGGEGSVQRRRALQKRLSLPQALSANALPGVLNRIITREELSALAEELSQELGEEE